MNGWVADGRLEGERAGPNRGGLEARLRLRFAIAVDGPILLGQDSHAGTDGEEVAHTIPGGRTPDAGGITAKAGRPRLRQPKQQGWRRGV
jgi:hypothetical protein